MTINRTYVTGDTHLRKDLDHLKMIANFYETNITENDVIIICGDAGLTWHNDTCKNLDLIFEYNDLPCTLAIIDGNHENFETLYNYPKTHHFGGPVRKITNKIFYLERGQVYNINDVKIFAFGGGHSPDKMHLVPYVDWWPQEIPNLTQMRHGLENLDKVNWNVDYMITHTCALHDLIDLETEIFENFTRGRNHPEYNLNFFFSEIKKRLNYKHHYCGHFHKDLTVNKKTTFVFESYHELTNYD